MCTPSECSACAARLCTDTSPPPSSSSSSSSSIVHASNSRATIGPTSLRLQMSFRCEGAQGGRGASGEDRAGVRALRALGASRARPHGRVCARSCARSCAWSRVRTL
eukprot:2407187-Prymnesium_polylepis.1